MASSFKCASIDSDVIFATSTPLTIALPAVYGAFRRKVPMVFEVRDLWPELPIAVGALRNPSTIWLARRLERFAYANAEAVVALSPGMRDGIAEAGYPSTRIKIIPNSADLELFGSSSTRAIEFRNLHPELDQRPLIIYAGTIGIINGVDYLARIAFQSKFIGDSVQYAVVGDGREMSALLATAKEMGILGRNFHVFGPVPKEDMPTVLGAADVAISLFVDLKEMQANSANKFFDALASGTPIAINYGGWQSDLLASTGAGITLPANDPAAAAQLLADFAHDPMRIRAAGIAARKLAEVQFSRDELAISLEETLQGAISSYTARK